MNADFARGGAGMNDDGREPSCEIQVARGALVGVTRGPRRVRRGFEAFGAAAGLAAAGGFTAGAGAALRTSADFAAAGIAFAGRACADFFAAAFGAAACCFEATATFFERTAPFFGTLIAGFGNAFATAFFAVTDFFGDGWAAFATFFGAGFTALGAALAVFGAGFAGLETAWGRFGAAVFFETGFAAAFFGADFNFFTTLDLLATLLPEVFIRAVVVDVLLFARAIVHSLYLR